MGQTFSVIEALYLTALGLGVFSLILGVTTFAVDRFFIQKGERDYGTATWHRSGYS